MAAKKHPTIDPASLARKQSSIDPLLMARKQSVADSLGRKSSIEKKSLDIPGYAGGRRPSIMGMERRPSFMFDRRMSMADSLAGRSGLMMPSSKERIKYENTYRLEPDEAFPAGRAKKIAQDILESTLKGQEYDKDECTKLSKSLADTIKQHVKAMNFSRYKVITVVAIGQQQTDTRPSATFTSRCIWNEKLDTYVEATYKSKTLYAIALVYALYAD